jgi:hypothetical protein
MKKHLTILGIAALAGLAFWGAHASSRAVHAQTGYTLDALRGTYGFTEQGSMGSNLAVVGIGVLNADGNGGVSGSENINILGQAAQSRTFQGSYTVKPDGTGMLTLNYAATPSDQIGTDEGGNPIYSQAGLIARYAFVVVNNKLEFRAIRGDGYTSSAAFVRQ